MRYFDILFTDKDSNPLKKIGLEKLQEDISFNATENARCSPFTIKTKKINVPILSFVFVRLYDDERQINGQVVYKGVLVSEKLTRTNTKDQRVDEYEYEIVHIGYLLEKTFDSISGPTVPDYISSMVSKLNAKYPGIFSVGTVSTSGTVNIGSNKAMKQHLEDINSVTNYTWSVGPVGQISCVSATDGGDEKKINEGSIVSLLQLSNDLFYYNNKIFFVIEYSSGGPEPVQLIKTYTKTDSNPITDIELADDLGLIGFASDEDSADVLAEQYAIDYFEKIKNSTSETEIQVNKDYNIYDINVFDKVTLSNTELEVLLARVIDVDYSPTGGVIRIGRVVRAERSVLGQ